MSPYIITTTTPDREPGAIDRHSGSILACVSRRAVATLEGKHGAHEAVSDEIRTARDRIAPAIEHHWPAAREIRRRITETGGTITLPDGTVIEVVGLMEGCVLRTARANWPCAGDGSSTRRHAPGCPGSIERGDSYIEYVGEAPAYQSGSRHSLACASAFHRAAYNSAQGVVA